MIAIISNGDWEELQRLLEEQQAEEQAAKPKKAFQHRTMPESKCPSCQLAVTVRGRAVCEASGMPVIETSGVGRCAYLPVKKADDD